jgi:hypothetical protein
MSRGDSLLFGPWMAKHGFKQKDGMEIFFSKKNLSRRIPTETEKFHLVPTIEGTAITLAARRYIHRNGALSKILECKLTFLSSASANNSPHGQGLA